MLANLGVPPGDLEWAAERVESGLLRTLRDPRGRWVLDESCRRRERAADRRIDRTASLCEAVIDRTFIDENGVRWIIDYKTSEHEGADLENFLEQEKERYREQLERYARLMSSGTIVPSGWDCIFRCWANGWNGRRQWFCASRRCYSSFSERVC